MTYSSNADAWGDGTGAGATAPTPKKKSGRWWKILIGVVVVLAILLVVAEFGLRAYAKNTVADEMRSSLEKDGTELSEDPSVSFGASPLLLGLAQGKIPSFEATVPSTMSVSYEDSDESRPMVSGQPEMTLNAEDMEASGDDPVVGELTVDTVLPPELIQAELQKSEAEGGDAEGGAEGGADAENAQDDGGAPEDDNPLAGALEGLMTVSGVEMNQDANTMDVIIGGGLATLSMTPSLQDDGLTFEVADVQIFGMSLPEGLADELTKNLESSVNETEGLQISDAQVTPEGLKVQLHGTDVNLNDIDTSGGLGVGGDSGGEGGSPDGEGDGAGAGGGADEASTDLALGLAR